MLTAEQNKKIIAALVAIMKAIEDHKHEVVVDPTDIGTDYTVAGGTKPSFDERLTSWGKDAVGKALRLGARRLGELFIPLATRQELEDIANKVAARASNTESARAILNDMFDNLTSSDGYKFLA